VASRMSFHPMDATLKGILVLGPAIMALVSALHLDAVAGFVILALSVAALGGVIFGLGVRISDARDHIVLSLVPFWRSRLPKNLIAIVELDEIRPFEDFGGWGIKGQPRKKGLLYSAGGTTVLRFVLTDGRCYLASIPDREASAILATVVGAQGSPPGRVKE
jgi:hypothetical protein